MPGLLHPKNVAPDFEAGIKEGFIRVDSSSFRVVKPQEPKEKKANYVARQPFLALSWSVTRLDENLEVVTDENDNPKTEVIDFSFGGKSIKAVHPGNADSPDDKEIEDLGDAVNTEGNTVFIVDPGYKPNKNCAVHLLFVSLMDKVAEAILDRDWAPDWTGMVCFIKGRPSGAENTMAGDDGKERQWTVKYVEKVVSMATKGKKGTGAAANGKPDDAAIKTLKPILEAIAEENAGDKITFKALANKVSTALKKGNVDVKLHIPILGLVKDEAWLTANGEKYNMTVDTGDQIISFAENA